MRAVSWMTCWWPGLSALWHRGQWEGLAVAIGFGLSVQLALLQTFAPSIAPLPITPAIAWSSVLGLWVAGVWFGWRQMGPRSSLQDPQIDQWLREAQAEYLKGHWIEAEGVLARLLARRPDDVEGLLLLATIQRRTRRLSEAQRTLEDLAQRQQAVRWAWEIGLEGQRLSQLEQEDSTSETGEGQQAIPRAA